MELQSQSQTTRYERLVVQEQRTETSRMTQDIESLRAELDQTRRHADLSTSKVCPPRSTHTHAGHRALYTAMQPGTPPAMQHLLLLLPLVHVRVQCSPLVYWQFSSEYCTGVLRALRSVALPLPLGAFVHLIVPVRLW